MKSLSDKKNQLNLYDLILYDLKGEKSDLDSGFRCKAAAPAIWREGRPKREFQIQAI